MTFSSICKTALLECEKRTYKKPSKKSNIPNILKERARARTKGLIIKGLLPSLRNLQCVDCGKPAKEYDHRNYNDPLNVDAVCRSCNIRRGPGGLF